MLKETHSPGTTWVAGGGRAGGRVGGDDGQGQAVEGGARGSPGVPQNLPALEQGPVWWGWAR